MKNIQLLIIGGGSAGLSAAIEAYDNGIKDLLIVERNTYLGGVLNQCIHDGFGLSEFKELLTGPEYAHRFILEIKKRNIPYICNSTVTQIDKDKTVHVLNSEGLTLYKCKAIIFAAGCYERNSGAIALPGDRPSGVMTAGLAQQLLNIEGYLVGKKVFILGSGDIGLIMARRMTLEGAQVVGVAEIMPYSNGLPRNLSQCLYDFNIPLLLSHTVTKIIGKSYLEAIEVSEVDSFLKPIPSTKVRYDVDLLLLSIGLIPNTDLLRDIDINLSKNKGAIVDNNLMCSIDGFFTCGNVLHVHDLVDNVTQESRIAGRSAAKFILGETHKGKRISVIAKDNVSYVIPQFIDLNTTESTVDIKFRVKKILNFCTVIIRSGGNIIKRLVKPILVPSEMVVLSIPTSLLRSENDIEILVEERK